MFSFMRSVFHETSLENIDAYSVLRFFNRLKDPGCKSLILLNLRSLETKDKHTWIKQSICYCCGLHHALSKYDF